MAGQALTCFLLLLTLNLSFVLCDDDYFKNHYYDMNGHHKNTSGADVSATEATILSSSNSRESADNNVDIRHEKYTGFEDNKSNNYHTVDDGLVMRIRVIMIVVAIAYVIIILLIIKYCPCCRAKPRPGFILSNNTTMSITVTPQPVVVESQHQQQQQQMVQPAYPMQPMQEQYQPSGPQFQPAVYQEFHNPPVSPPPYQEKQHY